MNNQALVLSIVILCSLGGWYVVISKYLEIKSMVKQKNPHDYPYSGQHIPGMGPAPVGDIPFTIPHDLLEEVNYNMQSEPEYDPYAQTYHNPNSAHVSQPQHQAPKASPDEKRQICNMASIIHVAGFSIISGVPFLNVVIPTILWLWKKDQHPFIARQGREVINFQITYTLIQFICLGLGALYMWLMPASAGALFAKTKIIRAVFSTSMYLPFNIFTVVPFFWGCMMMIRGSVAAYHGLAYKYPLAQPFIFSGNPAGNSAPNAGVQPSI
jgi:uncharacterized Tic20 family protein